jgi:hypothetical protein
MLITIKELGISSDDVKTFSNREDLLKIKTELDTLLIVLNSHLEKYKIEYVQNGVSGNYSKFNNLKTKKKLYGIMSQLMQIRIGEISKIDRAKNRHLFLEILVNRLKENIDGNIFYKIVEEVKNEVTESQND